MVRALNDHRIPRAEEWLDGRGGGSTSSGSMKNRTSPGSSATNTRRTCRRSGAGCFVGPGVERLGGSKGDWSCELRGSAALHRQRHGDCDPGPHSEIELNPGRLGCLPRRMIGDDHRSPVSSSTWVGRSAGGLQVSCSNATSASMAASSCHGRRLKPMFQETILSGFIRFRFHLAGSGPTHPDSAETAPPIHPSSLLLVASVSSCSLWIPTASAPYRP